jgi:hypothetical protein
MRWAASDHFEDQWLTSEQKLECSKMLRVGTHECSCATEGYPPSTSQPLIPLTLLSPRNKGQLGANMHKCPLEKLSIIVNGEHALIGENIPLTFGSEEALFGLWNTDKKGLGFQNAPFSRVRE